FDHALAEWIIGQENLGQISSVTAKTLLLAARKTKEALTSAKTAAFVATIDGREINRSVTLETFEQLIEPMLVRTQKACRQVVEDAKVSVGEIKGVVLV